MALAAALARASTRLLRGGIPPSAASPALSSRSRPFCTLPAAADEPSAPPGAVEEPWEEAEAEILRDVKPVVKLVKDIIHSGRYGDGGFLSPDDEKVIVEKVLAHHPRSEDKIGCGLDAILVDKHPDFRKTRCLFIARTNGDVEDFSYRKCLRAYVKRAYPSHADRFIDKHLGQERPTLFRPRK
ncbi:protein DCL homolog, chloroplastic [Lolium perenne]|uniref:protein DCL homolog, chloroplastic n=1 Tax=Lolium perenne TaxID=4522 RepID=UPI0021F56E47|nr:protein DCL homolog, chloroplastic-like [Lolium perenne]